jgi:hypothetical protein
MNPCSRNLEGYKSDLRQVLRQERAQLLIGEDWNIYFIYIYPATSTDRGVQMASIDSG